VLPISAHQSCVHPWIALESTMISDRENVAYKVTQQAVRAKDYLQATEVFRSGLPEACCHSWELAFDKNLRFVSCLSIERCNVLQ
jgi:hypothetical protein